MAEVICNKQVYNTFKNTIELSSADNYLIEKRHQFKIQSDFTKMSQLTVFFWFRGIAKQKFADLTLNQQFNYGLKSDVPMPQKYPEKTNRRQCNGLCQIKVVLDMWVM